MQYFTPDEIKLLNNREISDLFNKINKYKPTTIEIEYFRNTGVPKKIPFILDRKENKIVHNYLVN